MNTHVKNYAIFFAYMAITAIVVRPLIKSMNIPLLQNV